MRFCSKYDEISLGHKERLSLMYVNPKITPKTKFSATVKGVMYFPKRDAIGR